MKKFRFRFQSVLEVREKSLENCQIEVVKIQQKLNQELLRLEEIYSILSCTKKGLESLLQKGNTMDLLLINEYHGYILRLKTNIEEQKENIARVNKELEKKKQALIKALKEKKIIEKLKEKDLQKFKAELEKAQMIEIDEIVSNRSKSSQLY